METAQKTKTTIPTFQEFRDQIFTIIKKFGELYPESIFAPAVFIGVIDPDGDYRLVNQVGDFSSKETKEDFIKILQHAKKIFNLGEHKAIYYMFISECYMAKIDKNSTEPEDQIGASTYKSPKDREDSEEVLLMILESPTEQIMESYSIENRADLKLLSREVLSGKEGAGGIFGSFIYNPINKKEDGNKENSFKEEHGTKEDSNQESNSTTTSTGDSR